MFRSPTNGPRVADLGFHLADGPGELDTLEGLARVAPVHLARQIRRGYQDIGSCGEGELPDRETGAFVVLPKESR